MAPLIELRNVSKVYSKGLIARASTVALDNLSLSLDADKPTIMTVAGESGSGKTTLAMLLLGFIEPSSGQIYYQGKDIILCVDTRMTGPFPSRTPTNESFAQFCSRDARDRVFQAMKEKSFKTPSCNTINIYRAKTEFVRGRDWAMGKGEGLIKKKLAAAKPNVPVE